MKGLQATLLVVFQCVNVIIPCGAWVTLPNELSSSTRWRKAQRRTNEIIPLHASSSPLVTGPGGKAATSAEEDLALTLELLLMDQSSSTTGSKEQFINVDEVSNTVSEQQQQQQPSISISTDVQVPYNAAARLAYEASADQYVSFADFEPNYRAEAIALVKSKQPSGVLDVSVPYNAAAKLAYEASDKSMSFADFEPKYLAEAVELVKSKMKPVDASVPYIPEAKVASKESSSSSSSDDGSILAAVTPIAPTEGTKPTVPTDTDNDAVVAGSDRPPVPEAKVASKETSNNSSCDDGSILAAVIPIAPTEVTEPTISTDTDNDAVVAGRDRPPVATGTPKRSATSAFSRAQRLAEISLGSLVGPFTTALFKRGFPQTEEEWNVFWELPIDDYKKNSLTLAQKVASVLEDMGPTFVKFGQSMAARPDIVPRSLAVALSTLQDQMQPFDTQIAKQILEAELSTTNKEDCEAILNSLSDTPVAAASIGQVYSARRKNQQKVAIKVQRPGIRDVVEQDATLLLRVAEWLESLPDPRQQQERLIRTDISGAVNEFMTRLKEELDYRNEANNLEIFASLYSHRRPTNTSVQVVVPEVYDELCTENVLVMEWLDGTKLVDLETEESSRQSLAMIEQGIDCTLSQLLETGIMHADAHAGNLLKVQEPPSVKGRRRRTATEPRLGYVDFGLLATVPVEVRDGLVCSVAELVFERNVTAVAQLFGELALIPDSVLQSPSEMEALGQELEAALFEVLVYPNSTTVSSTTIPQLRFDKLLNVLSRLVPRFSFELPPYFLNNARSLGTLEGMAREIQPSFNVLQFLYPYALQRIVANPSQSPVVEQTLNHLLTHPESGRIDRHKIRRLIHDVTLLTGYSKTRLLRDVLASPNGPRLVRRVVGESVTQAAGRRKKRGAERRQSQKRQSRASSRFFRL